MKRHPNEPRCYNFRVVRGPLRLLLAMSALALLVPAVARAQAAKAAEEATAAESSGGDDGNGPQPDLPDLVQVALQLARHRPANLPSNPKSKSHTVGETDSFPRGFVPRKLTVFPTEKYPRMGLAS